MPKGPLKYSCEMKITLSPHLNNQASNLCIVIAKVINNNNSNNNSNNNNSNNNNNNNNELID